jgi:starch phosphorylase
MTHAVRPQLPDLPEALDALADLALDLRWSWSHTTDTLWERIDPDIWALTRNPWLILQNTSADKLGALADDASFVATLQGFVEERSEWLASPTWFQTAHPQSALKHVAYFSMEFGLSESLPIYSGGLGILAGDLLKTASDLGVPMVGVGLLWQQGYFRQSLNEHGGQREFFPYNDPAQLPVQPVHDAQGKRLRVELPFPGRDVLLRVWQVQVGRVLLYLLDSNDPLNTPADRGITAELYGGSSEMRLQQEFCLGVGGCSLLQHLGIEPEVYHLNEGHAAFVVLARAWKHMRDYGSDFRCALNATRAGNVFTTHTPVAVGFDRFAPELLERYMERARQGRDVSPQAVLALGRENPNDASEPFKMAYLAIRGSLLVNGVSRLHGDVSRRLFQPLFPNWPEQEVPITHITNGVHMPSWDSSEADRIWTDSCGKDRWLGELEHLEEQVCLVSDEALWDIRNRDRQRLIGFARDHLQRQLAAVNAPPEHIERASCALDPNTFTLGFARRFTAYKRPEMLLADPERLHRILTNPLYPVQLIIAGKAHPKDETGKAIIRQWNEFIGSRPELVGHVVFLADYDMFIAEQMVQGVDLWINTPRRPWEACGTSGMKVLVNGGLNLSELDGWWAEAYAPELGWSLGDRQEHNSDPAWDAAEAAELYRLLEEEITPLFYHDRDAQGCPCGWVARMRASMSTLTPRFSSNRMLREYVEQLYLPATEHFAERLDMTPNQHMRDWQDALDKHWDRIRFGDLHIDTEADAWLFSIPVYLGELDAEFIAVQLYAMPPDGGEAELHRMQCGAPLSGAVNAYTFSIRVPQTLAANDYTPRIIPAFDGALVPIEAHQILWYR